MVLQLMHVIDKLQKVKIKAGNTAADSMHLSVSGLCSIYVVFNTVLVGTNIHKWSIFLPLY